MKRLFFLLICCLFFGTLLSAQIPGYLGNRFSLRATGWTSMVLDNMTAANQGPGAYGAQAGSFALNGRAGLRAAYATSRRHQVSFGVERFRTGMEMDASTLALQAQTTFGPFDDHYLFYQLNGTSFSLSMEWFNPLKGSLAPMGAYNALGLHATLINGTIQDKLTTYVYSPEGGHRNLGIDHSMVTWALGYEFGYNHILFDRLVLNVSGQIQIPLQLDKLSRDWFAYAPIVNLEDDYLGYNQEEFENAVVSRMFGHNFFSFGMGIGVLLF